MAYPLDLYHNLITDPMLKSKQALCFELDAVHARLTKLPCCATVGEALRFIHVNKRPILNQFGLCAWTYAICQQEPALSWGDAVEFTVQAMEGVMQKKLYMGKRLCDYTVTDVNEWAEALDAWSKFYTAIKTGCCARAADGHMGARYVIRQTPDEPPYFGRTMCIPTKTPAKLTERSYASNMECQMALMQLPPQQEAVPVVGNVYCNQYGCYDVVGWAPKPPYNYDCASSGFCCGSNCATQKPSMPYRAADQYKYYA